ncbi:hypothetical protein GbCGDNIH6_8213 [Granulibacter bethesdensis]|nr:hypothetical protein GbCGDNIH6_8213 [Granulibacter bethesdensis]
MQAKWLHGYKVTGFHLIRPVSEDNFRHGAAFSGWHRAPPDIHDGRWVSAGSSPEWLIPAGIAVMTGSRLTASAAIRIYSIRMRVSPVGIMAELRMPCHVARFPNSCTPDHAPAKRRLWNEISSTA